MSWFSCCFTAKRKKNNEQVYSNQQLPKSRSELKQQTLQQEKLLKYKNISKINLPSKISKHSMIRNQDYTELSDKTSGIKIYITDQELNFQMDYQDGISHNLTINTFNYKPQNQNPQIMYYQHIKNQQFDQKTQQKPIKTTLQNKNSLQFSLKDQTQQQPTGF